MNTAGDFADAPAQAHAYLVSFRKIGLVEQDPQSGLYRVGPFALQLGLARLRAVDALRLAGAAVAAFAEEISLMVTVTVWGSFGPTIVQVLEGTRQVHVNLRAGAVYSLTGTATGLVWAKVRAALSDSLPVWSLGLLGAGCASKDAADVVGSLASHLWGWVALATVLYFWAWCLWLSPVLRRLALPAAILAVVAVWFVAGLVNAALGANAEVGGAVMLAILATRPPSPCAAKPALRGG